MTLYIPDFYELGLTDLDTEYWMTRRRWSGTREPINVADLSERHRRNLLGWLRAHAVQLHASQRRVYVLLDRAEDSSSPGLARPRPGRDRVDWLDAQDPHVWLEDTALVRRLVDLTPPEPRAPRRTRHLPRRLTGARR